MDLMSYLDLVNYILEWTLFCPSFIKEEDKDEVIKQPTGVLRVVHSARYIDGGADC